MNELHNAAEKGDMHTIRNILASDPDSIKKFHSTNGTLPIVHAVRKGQLAAVKLLLETGFPKPTDPVDTRGYPLIHYACIGGHIPMVEFLLNSGFSLNVKVNNSSTVMHTAAGGGQKGMMEYLVKKGFSYNVQGINGWEPVHAAAQHDQLGIVKFLVHEIGISCTKLLDNNKGEVFSWCGEKVKKFVLEQEQLNQQLLIRTPRSRQLPNTIPVESSATTEIEKLKKQVAALESDKQTQQALINYQEQEIATLKTRLAQQQQTITASEASNPEKTPWTPGMYYPPISSTSFSAPDDVEITGANKNGLHTLSSAAIKTESTEIAKNPHSREKHPLEENAEISQAKRQR